MDLSMHKNRMGQGYFHRFIQRTNVDYTQPTTTQAAIQTIAETGIMIKYPEASSVNFANHWEFLLTDPMAFYTATVAAYNAQPDVATKEAYKGSVNALVTELQLDRKAALPALAQLPTNELQHWIAVFMPEWTEWAWVIWAQRDMEGFLNAHFPNIEKLDEAGQYAAGAQLKNLFDVHIGERWFDGAEDTVSKKNLYYYLQIAEPEIWASMVERGVIQAAQLSREKTMGQIMGFGILGVMGLGLFSLMGKK